MAYVERYFKTIETDEHTIRLSIKERVRAVTGSSSPKEIGDFNSLQLHIQGQQASLESPIVKTSVTFSMFDTIDKQDTAHVKYGGWEQFYTPDQTLWLVEIRQDGTLTWSGYITPDSWEDDLVYRGLITITARDMLGHMADFEVKETDFQNIETKGMATISDIIQQGFYAAQVPMSLVVHSSAPWLTHEGAKLYDWALDITALIGKNWYEAVEGILDSFGLTLRYSGRNTVVLAPIRNIPLCGYASARAEYYAPQFLRRSGHRELVPAYKQVVETINYEAHADLIDTFPEAVFAWGEFEKEGWDEVTYSGGSWRTGSGLGMVKQFTASNAFNDIVGDKSRYFLMKHQAWKPSAESTRNGLRRSVMVPPSVSVDVSFKLAHTYTLRGTVVTPYERLVQGQTYVYVEWLKTDGASLWLGEDGAWGDTLSLFLGAEHAATDTEGNVALSVTTPDMPGTLRVYFFYGSSDTSVTRYVRVGDFSVSVNAGSIPQSLSVTTQYDAAQNTTLNRDPMFGAVTEWIKSAGAIRNGVYLNDAQSNFPPVRTVQWDGTGAALPLSVFIHMQHLAMHAKANNVLTGEIRELHGAVPGVDAVWKIYDRQFVLVSGTIDYTTGFVGGATLVEYDPYDLVWSGMSVDYDTASGGYRKPTGGASSSTSSSSQGSGGGPVPEPEPSEPYHLPLASPDEVGGVKTGFPASRTRIPLEMYDERAFVELTAAAIIEALGYPPASPAEGSTMNPYILPGAAEDALGGVKLGHPATGASVPLETFNDRAFVSITAAAIAEALGYVPASRKDSASPFRDTDTEGAFFADENGNVFAEYTPAGFDTTPSNSFKRKVMGNMFRITDESGAYLTDENGNVFAEYTAAGFDTMPSPSFMARLGIQPRKRIDITRADTELAIFNKMYEAFTVGNCDVYWETGTYTFSAVYNYMYNTLGWRWTMEIPVGNNCNYYFNNSTIISNPPSGAYTESRNIFGTKASVQTFTMHDGTLINNGGTYCVHDEVSGNEGLYIHEYHNMTMQYVAGDVTEGLAKCIGGGSGANGIVRIVNCHFSTDNPKTNTCDVSWHGNTRSIYSMMKIYVTGCYFSRGMDLNWSDSGGWNDNEYITLHFCGNSVTIMPHDTAEGRFRAFTFNNEIRNG